MSLPTKEELVLLETFRNNVADILTDEENSDDMFLLRWLRARDLNLKDAEDMLRAAKKWRLDNKLDEKGSFDDIQKVYYRDNFPMYVEAMDKCGRPVFSCAFGKWDVRKVVKEGKSQEFFTYITDRFEECSKAIKKSSKMHPPKDGEPPITQLIGIYDWKGFAWGQLFSYQSVQNLLQIGALYEAYYPEILHTCYFINCPSLISSVLVLLKPVIAPRTMAKIKCIGTDTEAWRKELLERIDADQLRPEFGGTKTDGFNPFQ